MNSKDHLPGFTLSTNIFLSGVGSSATGVALVGNANILMCSVI